MKFNIIIYFILFCLSSCTFSQNKNEIEHQVTDDFSDWESYSNEILETAKLSKSILDTLNSRVSRFLYKKGDGVIILTNTGQKNSTEEQSGSSIAGNVKEPGKFNIDFYRDAIPPYETFVPSVSPGVNTVKRGGVESKIYETQTLTIEWKKNSDGTSEVVGIKLGDVGGNGVYFAITAVDVDPKSNKIIIKVEAHFEKVTTSTASFNSEAGLKIGTSGKKAGGEWSLYADGRWSMSREVTTKNSDSNYSFGFKINLTYSSDGVLSFDDNESHMFKNGERFDGALKMENSQQVRDIVTTITGQTDRLLRIRYDARPNNVR